MGPAPERTFSPPGEPLAASLGLRHFRYTPTPGIITSGAFPPGPGKPLARLDTGFRTYTPEDVGARVVLSVAELTEQLRFIVGHNRFLQDLWIRGEVADPSGRPSGNLYFTLADDEARIHCVMFARQARSLAFHLEEGQEVVVEGDVEVYGPRGTYELVVKTVEPSGLGAQYLALIQLRARLRAEGMFSPGAKRPLPPFPAGVGVVTSEHGAALVDVLLVLGDRWPMADVIVAPARVQGEGAADSIVAALELLGRRGGADVVLLGRGGGSGEDLVAFDDEIVVRAIRACPVPVVSCVGHEVDWTLADLAADARAPTPTAGAALVVPDRAEVSLHLHRTAAGMAEGMRRFLIGSEGNLGGQAKLLTAGPPEELLAQGRRTLATSRKGLEGGATTWLRMAMEHLGAQGALLETSGPPATLARGYAIALRGADRRPLASVSGVGPGEELTVLLADGEVTCRVVGVRPQVI